MNRIVLYPKQQTAIDTESFRTIFVSGIRGGKTVGAGSHFAIKKILERPKEKGIIFSNTTKQLNLSTLHEFMKVLAYYDMHEYSSFVKNKNPYKYFGHTSNFDNHQGVWSFKNGAQVLVFSLEASFRGTEFGWAWGDEIQDASITGVNTVVGRLSGSKEPRILLTLTPPEKNPDIEEMVFPQDSEGDKEMEEKGDGVFYDKDTDTTYIYGSTYDNRKNLPKGYIEMVEATYDPVTAARELGGAKSDNTSGRFMYCFDKAKHVSKKAVYKENKLVYLSFDFNVSPAACIAWHQGRHDNGEPWIHYFDEICIDDANVYKMCNEVNARFGKDELIITGDRTAIKREFTQRSNAVNTWSIIKKELGVNQAQIKLVNNPDASDNIILCNSILHNHPEILFHPKCKMSIRDMTFVKVDEYNKIVKKSRQNIHQRADFLDVIRYSLNTFHSGFLKQIRKAS